jgi:hypothetical protein
MRLLFSNDFLAELNRIHFFALSSVFGKSEFEEFQASGGGFCPLHYCNGLNLQRVRLRFIRLWSIIIVKVYLLV